MKINDKIKILNKLIGQNLWISGYTSLFSRNVYIQPLSLHNNSLLVYNAIDLDFLIGCAKNNIYDIDFDNIEIEFDRTMFKQESSSIRNIFLTEPIEIYTEDELLDFIRGNVV